MPHYILTEDQEHEIYEVIWSMQLVIDLADAVPLDKTVVQIDSRALSSFLTDIQKRLPKSEELSYIPR
jgi:hypothetical protein